MPELDPGGITWEMAMQYAAKMMAEAEKRSHTFGSIAGAAAYANIAQGWISFAREITVHGRVSDR